MVRAWGTVATLRIEMPDSEVGGRLSRTIVRGILEARAVESSRIDDCLLVLGELVANVSLHARSPSGHFLLALDCDGDEARFTVTDQGSGFDPLAVGTPGTRRGDGRIGGMGIPLVQRLCRRAEWYPTSMGTTVRAAIGLCEAPPPEPLALDLMLDDEDARWLAGQLAAAA